MFGYQTVGLQGAVVVAVAKESHAGLHGFLELVDQFLIRRAEGAIAFFGNYPGFGRTGRFFACEHFDLAPDIMTVAKAMGGGVPIGAALLSADIDVGPGMHGTTFGGNPLACAASLAAINILEDENLAARAVEMGDYFESRLREQPLSQVREIRRLGLMIGIELKQKAQEKLEFLLSRNIVALPAGANVIRMLPPLVIEREQIDQVVEALRDCLA